MATFSPGPRLLPHDKWVLLIATLVLSASYILAGPVIFSPLLTVVVQFFLFCNVFRIKTRLELVWASSFIPAVIVVYWWGGSPWLIPAILWSWGTVLIWIGSKSPAYCGLWWEKINPDLEKNWKQLNR
jgi:hypothetical protein